MNLLAVICIKDFHYVTFVKSGKGFLSHWVLFDSNPSDEKPKVCHFYFLTYYPIVKSANIINNPTLCK